MDDVAVMLQLLIPPLLDAAAFADVGWGRSKY